MDNYLPKQGNYIYFEIYQKCVDAIVLAIMEYTNNNGNFDTFVYNKIKKVIIESQTVSIRIPEIVIKAYNKLQLILKKELETNDTYPSIESLSDISKYSIECVTLLLDCFSGKHNPDEIIIIASKIEELLSKKNNRDNFVHDICNELNVSKEELPKLLDTLPSGEQAVLKMRFGLADGPCLSIEEIQSYFDVSKERILQIEAKAIRRLKYQLNSPRRSNGLRDYIET